MLKDNISAGIDKIRAINGVAACAIVSRDGIIAGKYFDRELNEPWFGALSATLLASAESAGTVIHMHNLGAVTIQADNADIIVLGAGENFLIAAILEGNADLNRVVSDARIIAKEIGQVI
ncbi:MAG: roadblock/LC7 domain-containing protein [Methanoregula sp.]|nr:roadblock/LC7 domain-containing protein [Methanoregula sp.]